MTNQEDTLRTDPHGEFEELAAGYALDALSTEDATRFRAHLATCADCRRLLAADRATTRLLPLALDERDASPGLRERILSAARATPPDPAGTPTGQAPPRRGETAGTPLTRRRTPLWPLAAAAVLLLAVAGLTFWNLRLQQELDNQAAQVRGQEAALTALAAGGRQWPLAGTDQAPGAGGLLIQDPGSERPLLVVQNLPDLPAGQVYAAWVFRDQTPLPAGLFRPDASGRQILRLEESIAGADQVALTIEPAGGRLTPTGPIVVAGTL